MITQTLSNTAFTDEYWMQQALQRAGRAEEAGEVPVGAVLVFKNTIIGEGWNQSIGLHDPTAHAEIQALRQGAAFLKNYRLAQTTLYVTLEPCMMCAGAMVHARIERLVIGASDPKTGAAGSVWDLLADPRWNHKISCATGILEGICAHQLRAFFKAKR
jgi:tRNA(adenine34) deaminase